MLLPSFLLVLLLALQPVCLLYTRAVMESAAGEVLRLASVSPGPSDEAVRAFALRRLAAVPELEIFHAGGEDDWAIRVDRASSGEDGSKACVVIEGAVRPLPVLGAFAGLFGERDADGRIVLRAEVEAAARPSWLEGDYGDWA